MPDFNDIDMFPRAHYEVDVFWADLEYTIAEHHEAGAYGKGLDLMPDFQRGHVWTDDQRAAYVEYILRGGEMGKVLIFNHDRWNSGEDGNYVIVDGLQRLTAVRRFLADELPVMGAVRSKWKGRMRMHCGFKWRILTLKTRAEVLKYYLTFNAGGSVHSPEEIARVRELLAKETK